MRTIWAGITRRSSLLVIGILAVTLPALADVYEIDFFGTDAPAPVDFTYDTTTDLFLSDVTVESVAFPGNTYVFSAGPLNNLPALPPYCTGPGPGGTAFGVLFGGNGCLGSGYWREFGGPSPGDVEFWFDRVMPTYYSVVAYLGPSSIGYTAGGLINGTFSGTFTTTDLTTSAVPEPVGLPLLLIGFLWCAEVVRYRKSAKDKA